MSKRRFIAGAICPQCQAVDRLVLITPDDGSDPIRQCVACGFSDQMNQTPRADVPGRLEKPRPAPHAEQSSPVRIIEPAKPPSSEGPQD